MNHTDALSALIVVLCCAYFSLSDRRLAHRHVLLSHLTHVLTKSYHLLASALYTSVGLPTPAWYSVSFYSHLLGLLRMNCVAVELRSPLVEYVAAVDALKLNSDSWKDVASLVGERTKRVMEERQREKEWEQRNAREEEEDDEGEESDDEAGGGEKADDSDDEASSDEEWSDSEDDESFRKEDEDSFQPVQFEWPMPQPPPAPTVVIVAAPIEQPILSSVPLPLPGLVPAQQQPVAILAPLSTAASPQPPTASSSSSFHSSSSPSSRSVLSFSSTLFPSYHGSALYANIACLNHSCEPNVVVHFDSDARPLLLSHGEGVQADRECCMTYCDVDGVSREARWKELDGYGFVCACERCEREIKEENESADGEKDKTVAPASSAAQSSAEVHQ